MYEDLIPVEEENLEDEVTVEEENVIVNTGGTTDYRRLNNKPSINNVELLDNLSLNDLGIDQDFVKDNNYVHTDNNYTSAEKQKLSTLENYDDTELKKEIKAEFDENNERFGLKTTREIHIEDSIDEDIQPTLYGYTKQETTSGKNILEVNERINNLTRNGVTLVINNDKTISLKGTATADTTFQISDNVYSKIGYYRVSGLPRDSSLSTYFINVWYYGDLTTTTTKYFNNENQQLIVTITIKNGTNCNNLVFKPMIEYSTTDFANAPVVFEPYTGGQPSPSPDYPQPIEVLTGDVEVKSNNDKEPTSEDYQESKLTYHLGDNFVASIGNVKDELIGNKLIKRIGKVVLDGSESWGTYQEGNDYFFYSNYILKAKDQYIDGLCTHFKVAKYYPRTPELFCFRNNGEGLYFRTKKVTSLEEWKTWLSQNPVEVYYVLAEPYEVEVNVEGELRTYNPVTNITTPSEIEYTYKNRIDLSQFVVDKNYVHTDNNYTSAEKQKLSSLQNYDDTEVRDLIDGKQDKGDYATKDYVEQEIATFDFIKIVTELPETGLVNRTYFVPKTNTETNDLYDEYMWVDGKWELVGTKQIEVDLTGYVKKSAFVYDEETKTLNIEV